MTFTMKITSKKVEDSGAVQVVLDRCDDSGKRTYNGHCSVTFGAEDWQPSFNLGAIARVEISE